METIRITVPLTKPQASALIKLAEKECRHPRDQARFIILKYLEAQGISPDILNQNIDPKAAPKATPCRL